MLYKRAEETGTTISYHFLCGDDAVWQFLPEDEATDHTGAKEGNHNSIGIERVICKGTNYAEALHNQAKLTATLMSKWDIPIENVKPHRGLQWKYTPEREDKTPCPSRMLAGQYGGWKRFIYEVKRCQKYNWYFKELLEEKNHSKSVSVTIEDIKEAVGSTDIRLSDITQIQQTIKTEINKSDKINGDDKKDIHDRTL